jgi:hypothetical protein
MLGLGVAPELMSPKSSPDPEPISPTKGGIAGGSKSGGEGDGVIGDCG